MKTPFLCWPPIFCCLALLSGCEKEDHDKPSTSSELPEVRILVVRPEAVTVVTDQPGRLEAFRQAEVRARVPGIVTKRTYQEGQEVQSGTQLFLIEPAPLQAALDAAEAALAEALANHSLAKDKLNRNQNLIASNAISVRDFQESVSAEKQAEAKIASAKANREMAKLQLEYTTVVSPIDGRARRANVTEGALVGEGAATLLTTVEQIDPIYVNFSQPASEVIALRNSIDDGSMDAVAEEDMKVELTFGDGSVYPQPGKLLFSDLAVDPGTDSIAMRAVFPNEKRKLLPGMYVRVSINSAVRKEAILLPRVAVLRGPEGAHVMTVNDQDQLEMTGIDADSMHGGQWLVRDGLKPGQRVVVENPGSISPGSKVKAVAIP